MADNLYQIGEPVPVHAEFRNAAGALTNTTVSLEISKPDGTAAASPSVTNTSTGVYDATIPSATIDQAGLWWYSFVGTGAIAATQQNSFLIESRYTSVGGWPLTTHALVSLPDTREYVLGNRLDDSQDSKLIRRINAMSEATFSYTNREWLPIQAATRKFFCRGNLRMVSFGPYDLVTPTLITAFTDYPTASQVNLTAPSTTVVGDYRLGPVGGMTPAGTFKWLDFSEYWFATWPFSWRGFQVTVTGTWGIGVVPEDVKEAVLIAIENSYKNPERAAVRNIGPESFQETLETFETTGDAPWRALPAESRALLAEYRDDPSPILV